VVGNKVYTLEGHENEVDKLSGEKVTVKGKVKAFMQTRQESKWRDPRLTASGPLPASTP
jgi:hypothetical protein